MAAFSVAIMVWVADGIYDLMAGRFLVGIATGMITVTTPPILS